MIEPLLVSVEPENPAADSEPVLLIAPFTVMLLLALIVPLLVRPPKVFDPTEPSVAVAPVSLVNSPVTPSAPCEVSVPEL